MPAAAAPTAEPTPAEAADFRAQHGEDRALFAYFGGRREGFYVEVGAYNGVDFSNTYFFERIGWRGVLVEPHPSLAGRCRSARPRSTVVECAVVPPGAPAAVTLQVSDGAELYSSLEMDAAARRQVRRETGALVVREVRAEARTLDAILEGAGAPAVDFVTIDVEGHELGVLKGFTLARWRPKVVILERNGLAPPPAIVREMARGGYVLGRRTGVNDWYFAAADGASRSPGYLARLALAEYGWKPAWALFKAAARPVTRPTKALLGRAGLLGRRPAPGAPGADAR